jgi:hypothetical protein
MGMTCTLHRVPSADIDALLGDPSRVRQILFADDENWIVTKPKGIAGFLLRFTPLSIESTSRKEPITDEELSRLREIECDLEGAWHGLHFLFTGTAWEGDQPACYLIQGGEDVGDDEFDVPPRLLRPELALDFSQFLAGLSDDELRRRYDPDRMTELKIDPRGLWLDATPRSGRALDMLLESFEELKSFAQRASAADDGLIVHLG